MDTIKQFAVLLLAVIFSACSLMAAESENAQSGDRFFMPDRMFPADRFIVTPFIDVWQDVPDGMDLKTLQRGINISALQDMPLGRTNFSVAAGLGFTSHNLYSDHRYLYDPANDGFDFHPMAPGHDYDKNKISLNYLDVPVQIRYRSRELPSTLRFYLGMKAGLLINAHTKYIGTGYYDMLHYEDSDNGVVAIDRTGKLKEHKLENINSFSIGLTATIGYGMFNFFAFYPLTDVFEDNSVASMRPISLGVSLIFF